MENRLKMRISRMFRSSFGSCRNRNITDVMEKAVFTPPPNRHGGFHHLIMIEPPPPPPPRPRPFPSICKPKSSQTSKTIDDNCILSFKDSLPRRTRVSELSSPFAVDGGGFCPPAAPNTPLNTIYEHEFSFYEKTKNKNSSSARDFKNKKKKKKKKNKKKKMVNAHKKRDMFPFNSCAKDTNFGGYWWYSSDEDDETDTLFSSKSLSSDSSRSRRRHRSRRKNRVGERSSDTGVMPLQGKVKDTFAVVKRSSDPYSDFRTSMVEMIVEKQIFSPNGLENLLQCFLSLNSYHHHNIIVEVFTEIWEALFSDWF